MSRKTFTLPEEVYNYFCSVSLREPEMLQRLREETAKLPESGMQISPEQGQFMRLLVELIGGKKCLEIGTFTGYSSLCVALALPEDGKLVACDKSEEWTSVARRYWKQAGVEKKIQLILGSAIETLDTLVQRGETGTFDFAFIDADKSNYLGYYELVLRLVRGGGLILVDNVLRSGKVADASNKEDDTIAIREFNRRLHDDGRIFLSMIPMSDGITLARKL
ncbi:MAG: class I SAM-dependent methyltransferase [Bacteroidota bacterium]|nr:class I SAM-dependent methyltransferase [Bacteroidota bacterium]